MRGPRRAHPPPAYAASPAQIPETAVNPTRRGLTRRTPISTLLAPVSPLSLLPTPSLPGSLGRFGRMSPPARRSRVRFPLGSQESSHGRPVLGSNPSHLTCAIRFAEPPRHSRITSTAHRPRPSEETPAATCLPCTSGTRAQLPCSLFVPLRTKAVRLRGLNLAASLFHLLVAVTSCPCASAMLISFVEGIAAIAFFISSFVPVQMSQQVMPVFEDVSITGVHEFLQFESWQ